jgi:predicted GNAT family N-acyltransferase
MDLTVLTVAHGSAEYWQEVELRRRILRWPLGLDFNDEELNAEDSDYHVVAVNQNRLVGCLILTPKSEGEIKMRQVAVDGDAQGAGVGRAMVEYSERLARSTGYRLMSLHARDTAVPFYLKLGYETVSEEFVEVGIPHRKMQKLLATDPSDISG